MMWGNGMGGGMGWGFLFWILIIIGAAILIFVVVRSLNGRRGGSAGSAGSSRTAGPLGPPAEEPHGRAREILDERFARGEITEEEYRKLLRTLKDGDQ